MFVMVASFLAMAFGQDRSRPKLGFKLPYLPQRRIVRADAKCSQAEVENTTHLVFELLQVALQGCQAVDVVANSLAGRGRVGIQSVKEVFG
jgi:hypothetical protein